MHMCVSVRSVKQNRHKLKPVVINQACVGVRQAQRAKSVFKELPRNWNDEEVVKYRDSINEKNFCRSW